jgi:hypothetical protein
MNKDLTEIIVISDRSGSMDSCRSDAEGGINRFIRDQQEAPGEARLTFVQFNNLYEVLHDAKPIKEVHPYKLVPSGGTALLDAIGTALSTVGERLSKTNEKDRPGLVVCVISTDALDNASREYTAKQIAEMIKRQTETYSWQFQFLGANLDAIATCKELEIKTSGGIQLAPHKIGAGYRTSSDKVKMMRAAAAGGQSMATIASLNSYTDAERKDLS